MRPSQPRLNRHALTAIRERSDMSLGDLSRAAGVDCAWISRIERRDEARPSMDVIRKLAKALKVPPPALLLDPEPVEVGRD